MTTGVRRLLAVSLSAAIVFAAACSGDDSDEANGPPAGDGRSPGVTDDAIKVGIVLLDLDDLGPLGLGLDNFEVATQRGAFEAFLDEINENGGISGRAVEPVFVSSDPLDPDGERAACLKLTQDEEVFAVLGFVSGAMPCITTEHETPLIFHANDLAAGYDASANRLISPLASLERTALSWAVVMQETVAASTIGIVAVDDGGTQQRAADALEETLEQFGHTVDHRVRVTDATSAAAIELEVPKMRADGVDTVFLATDFATAAQFVRIAEQQGYTPQYLASEIGMLSSDGLVRRMPESFDGALAVTSGNGGQVSARSGEAPSAASANCIDQYNASTGENVVWGDEHPMLNICMMVRIFEAAATAAGDDLTQDRFVDAVQQLGDIELPGRYSGTFAPGKTDYADVFRILEWSNACTCYEAIGDPVAVG